jgi:hypothetical protein
MTKMTLLFAALFTLCVGARAHEGHAHDEAKEASGKPAAGATFEGEVVDLACYMADNDAGSKHAKCGKMCLTKDHVAAGLLAADGKLYALVEDHGAMKAMAKVRELGAEKVRITGSQVSKGGLQAIVVKDVAKL